jgi:hypothetical protein
MELKPEEQPLTGDDSDVLVCFAKSRQNYHRSCKSCEALNLLFNGDNFVRGTQLAIAATSL